MNTADDLRSPSGRRFWLAVVAANDSNRILVGKEKEFEVKSAKKSQKDPRLTSNLDRREVIVYMLLIVYMRDELHDEEHELLVLADRVLIARFTWIRQSGHLIVAIQVGWSNWSMETDECKRHKREAHGS